MSASGVDQPASGEEIAVPTPCRPFNVVDGMIAVAAVAIALAVARIAWTYYARLISGIPLGERAGFKDWWRYLTRHPWIVGGAAASTCAGLMVLLLIASLAFLAMRLRPPRPPLEHLVRQPGMVAAEAMWAGMVACVILDGYGLAPAFGMLALGLPVPMAWARLALTGRWQPEPGWIDRFGRALGVRWCLLVAFYVATMVIFHAFVPAAP